jgi:4-diphosphocytidyl-2-C-methyl-D-erythritol kinase
MTAWVGQHGCVSAPAKINLSLSIVGRRRDGYHELDSVVAPVDLYDEVAVTVSPSAAPEVLVRCTPPAAAPGGDENLVVRAARVFLRRMRLGARILIALTKRIPIGAGLGGGSSDAAAVLRCLNALAARPTSDDELAGWGLELGADVPLFLFGRPARMRGIGERLDPVEVDTKRSLVIAFSGIALDTAAVYAKHDDLLTTSNALHSIRSLTSGREALRHMQNDLEAAAVHLQPELRRLKERLSTLGAAGAAMTGSGSAMFGWWESRVEADAAASQLRASGIWAHAGGILKQTPAVELMTT